MIDCVKYLPRFTFSQNFLNKDMFYMMTVKSDVSPVRGDNNDAAIIQSSSG